MGGDVTVGIRRSNGDEYLGDRWTNPLPTRLSDAAFYDEGQAVADYIESGEMRRPLNAIKPIDYGLILIDFPQKIVFSRQEYMTPGQLFLGLRSNEPERRELALRLFERGWVHRVEVSPRMGSGPVCLTSSTVPYLLDFLKGKPLLLNADYAFIYWCAPGWTFDHQSWGGTYKWTDDQVEQVAKRVHSLGWHSRYENPDEWRASCSA